MLIKPECIPCVLKMCIGAIRNLSLDDGHEKQLYEKVLEIPSLRGQFWDITSAEVVELALRTITQATEKEDPFHHLKMEQNKRIMSVYPFLKDLVHTSQDPLYTAVKLAILGNAIDVMVSDGKTSIENSIQGQLEKPLPDTVYAEFREAVGRSRCLIFFGDNAGEIVFDKLLIDTIKKRWDMNVVYIVRSMPTLNDATVDEARMVGIDDMARIVENGLDGPCPGTVLSRCSEEVNELVGRADLIVSKGGGNFDTLDEEKKRELKKPIAFMLLSKCDPYAEYLGVDVGLPILANRF